MIQLLIFLVLVTPFPLYYLSKYVLENLAYKSPLHVILPNIFITILWIEMLLLYFAFNYLLFILVIVALIVISQSFITWKYFTIKNKQKENEILNLILQLKQYSMYIYVGLIIFSFLIHMIIEMFF